MFAKKSCILTLGLMAGLLYIDNAAAHASGGSLLPSNVLAKQQQRLVRSADSTLDDAESALLQARHVLMVDQNQSRASDAEIRQLQRLVAGEESNLKRAKKVANQDESINSEPDIESLWFNVKLVS